MPISVLSKGYKKPSTPTSSDLWWPAMEYNIQLMNDHTHDGTTGEYISKDSASVLAANWGSDLGGGIYRQSISMPGSRQFDSTFIQVKRSTGERVYAQIEKINATSFYIYTIDNSIAYTVTYV